MTSTFAVRNGSLPRALAMLAGILAIAFAVGMSGVSAAWAMPGSVYSCQVQRSYQNPVTGAVEDAGGESARATGQAMVESCIDAAGMMEVTDDGTCFFTIRMNLMDLTSNHAFQVQEWGEDGWSDPPLGVTQTGSNDLGDTSDVCIQLPSRKSVVRVSLYVNQMGRDVVCFCYPGEVSEGAPEGFVATMVTEASQTGAPDAAVLQQEPAADQEQPEEPAAGASAGAKDADAAGSAQAPEGGSSEAPAADADANPSAAEGIEGAGLPSAQGLSLSTAPEGGNAATQGAVGEEPSGAAQPAAAAASPFEVAAAVVAAGTFLMLVASIIVYWFRRNWNRIGGLDPDDYSREYRDA